MEDWKEWMDKIRSASDDIEIPESLHPDEMMKMLKAAEKRKKRKNVHRWSRPAAAAAAVFVMLAGGSALKMNLEVPMAAETASEMAEGALEMEDCDTAEAIEEEAEAEREEGAILTAKSYEEIYEKLKACEEIRELNEGAAGSDASADLTLGSMYESTAAEEKQDYSVTNTREASVDEADIVKTDGTYIYICMPDDKEVKIVRAEDLTVCGTIETADLAVLKELYVEDGSLIVLGERSTTALAEDTNGFYYSQYKTETVVRIYDIEDPEQPKEIASLSQEGNYYSSRKKEAYLYLFTDCQKWLGDADHVNSYVPEVNEILLDSDSVYLPSEHVTGHYLLISALNVEDPKSFTDAKGILCDSTDIYISHQNIYITQDRYDMEVNQTEIFKFWFYHGKIYSRAAGLVEGSLKDSFCIDEYNGNLRIATTAWTQNGEKSSLYVLDSELQVIGRLEDIAPGERVKSARFMGDTGYFVTFRRMDPLFCIDLSDPEELKILGELKVSGFSSYLHPYGEGWLLGMGEEAEESSGSFEGYKISMFDVSQPGEMKELDKVVFKNESIAGLNDYKTVLADADKNILGVSLEKWNAGTQTIYYQIYRFDEEQGFERCLNYEMETDKETSYNAGYIRGLYIGDTLYVVSPKEAAAFDMANGFERIGQLLF